MSRVYIFEALKAHLKARKMTYADLAQALQLSEPTVKRMFVIQDCTLERLEDICNILQVSLPQIIKSSPRQRNLINQLTPDQEAQLVANKKLLLCAVCAMNLWSFADMVKHLHIPEPECIRLLRKLEGIGILELHPGNQYRLLVARDFAWVVGGPIMNMVKAMADEYFDHRFDGDGELIKIINVRISNHSSEVLKRRLEQIAQEYADQVSMDAHLSLEERSPMSVCIAARRWVPDFMLPLVRFPDDESTSGIK